MKNAGANEVSFPDGLPPKHQSKDEVCGVRMAALLQATASAAKERIVPGAHVVYALQLLTFNKGDESAGMLRCAYRVSAVVCSQYYSKLEWALGETCDDLFSLSIPLEFCSTMELLSDLHSKIADRDGVAQIKATRHKH